MFKINDYTDALTAALSAEFGERLLYLGLQGSYLRGEAHEDSDIDIMAIIDRLTVDDLSRYRSVLMRVGEFEHSCGFICSAEDLAHWNPLEICHLLHTTGDLHGRLRDYVPAYTRLDVKNFVKLSVGNLYHEICHRHIHRDESRRAAGLPYSYKDVFFILQNLHYLETGNFLASIAELRAALSGNDVVILNMVTTVRGDKWDYSAAMEMLFTWCQSTLTRLDEI